jgi:uncharacterized protein (DUF697 family)
MANDESEVTAKRSEALGRSPLGGGRLGTYTALGGVCGVIPLPWVPDVTVRRVRGALVHDLTSRQGLSLTPEARAILTASGGADGPRGFLKQGAAFALSKVLQRIGPFGLLPPVRAALGTFVLGHLLQRYLETARTTRAARIDIDEARRIRRAMDQALLYALTTEPRSSGDERPFAAEDLREGSDQLVDGVLISLANLPNWLVRRLDAAFDEVLASVRA